MKKITTLDKKCTYNSIMILMLIMNSSCFVTANLSQSVNTHCDAKSRTLSLFFSLSLSLSA